MKRSTLIRRVRLIMVAMMALPIPNRAYAAQMLNEPSASHLISTSTVLEEMSRNERETSVRDYFQRDDVKAELTKKGIAPEEVNSRIASLSDQELQSLSGEIQQAKAGGNILVTVLLVVLIIYFIKRI